MQDCYIFGALAVDNKRLCDLNNPNIYELKLIINKFKLSFLVKE